jgi:hypothetical protein
MSNAAPWSSCIAREQLRGRQHAASWAGEHRAGREARRFVRRQDAEAAAHQPQLAAAECSLRRCV